MNLNEIQKILKDKLETSDKLSKSIIDILRIVQHQRYRTKQDIMDIIERDSK